MFKVFAARWMLPSSSMATSNINCRVFNRARTNQGIFITVDALFCVYIKTIWRTRGILIFIWLMRKSALVSPNDRVYIQMMGMTEIAKTNPFVIVPPQVN
jgi:hypothetical protein